MLPLRGSIASASAIACITLWAAAKRGLSSEQVPVLVARNRTGQMTDHILGAGNKQGLLAVLPTAVAPDAVLCTDGSVNRPGFSGGCFH